MSTVIPIQIDLNNNDIQASSSMVKSDSSYGKMKKRVKFESENGVATEEQELIDRSETMTSLNSVAKCVTHASSMQKSLSTFSTSSISNQRHFQSRLYEISDRDNPFRPDSELAKEANEDAKRFKYLSALEKSPSANTSHNQSASTTAPTSPTAAEAVTDAVQVQIDVKKDEAPQQVADKSQSPQKAVESAPKKIEEAAVSASPAKVNATNDADAKKSGKKKKSSGDDKVKPKCGCVIS